MGKRFRRLGLGLLAVLVLFLIVGLARPRLRLPGGGREPFPEAPEGGAEPPDAGAGIPHTIFTHWSGPPDDLAKKCMARMRAVNPDWDFVRLDEGPIEPCEGLDRLSVQALSDWVRLCALEEHGGVWLDATVVCVRPLEAWVDLGLDSLQGFSAWHPKVMGSWAMAAPPRHPLVSAWKAELRRAIGMGFDAYKRRAPPSARSYGTWARLPYLTVYACYLVACERTGLEARLTSSVLGAGAPYAYMHSWAWTPLGGRALKKERAPASMPALVKIGKYQRKCLRAFSCVEGSFWAELGLCESPPVARTEAHDVRDFALSVVGGWLCLAADVGLSITSSFRR